MAASQSAESDHSPPLSAKDDLVSMALAIPQKTLTMAKKKELLEELLWVSPELPHILRRKLELLRSSIIDALLGLSYIDNEISVPKEQGFSALPPLHHVVAIGSKDLVKLVFALRTNPMQLLDASGQTAAFHIKHDDPEMLKLLVAHGVDLNTISKGGYHLAHRLVDAGFYRCLTWLLQNYPDEMRYPCLGVAPSFLLFNQPLCDEAFLKLVLAELSLKELIGVLDGRQLAGVAKENPMFASDPTLLMLAARSNDVAKAEMLLDKIKQKTPSPEILENFINAYDTSGFNPVLAAALRGHTEMVLFLLEHGADSLCTTKETKQEKLAKENILILAIMGGFTETVRAICQTLPKAIKERLLQDHSSQVDSLNWAIAQNRWEIAVLLLENGANPNPRVKDNIVPLWRAIEKSRSDPKALEVVTALIEHGADPDDVLGAGAKTVMQLCIDTGNDAALSKIIKNSKFDILFYVWVPTATPNIDPIASARILPMCDRLILVERFLNYGANPNAVDAKGIQLLTRVLPCSPATNYFEWMREVTTNAWAYYDLLRLLLKADINLEAARPSYLCHLEKEKEKLRAMEKQDKLSISQDQKQLLISKTRYFLTMLEKILSIPLAQLDIFTATCEIELPLPSQKLAAPLLTEKPASLLAQAMLMILEEALHPTTGTSEFRPLLSTITLAVAEKYLKLTSTDDTARESQERFVAIAGECPGKELIFAPDLVATMVPFITKERLGSNLDVELFRCIIWLNLLSNTALLSKEKTDAIGKLLEIAVVTKNLRLKNVIGDFIYNDPLKMLPVVFFASSLRDYDAPDEQKRQLLKYIFRPSFSPMHRAPQAFHDQFINLLLDPEKYLRAPMNVDGKKIMPIFLTIYYELNFPLAILLAPDKGLLFSIDQNGNSLLLAAIEKEKVRDLICRTIIDYNRTSEISAPILRKLFVNEKTGANAVFRMIACGITKELLPFLENKTIAPLVKELINTSNELGLRPLQLAISMGDVPMVELLLANGADLNLPILEKPGCPATSAANYPLHFALLLVAQSESGSTQRKIAYLIADKFSRGEILITPQNFDANTMRLLMMQDEEIIVMIPAVMALLAKSTTPCVNPNLPAHDGFNAYHALCVNPHLWGILAELLRTYPADSKCGMKHMKSKDNEKHPLDLLFRRVAPGNKLPAPDNAEHLKIRREQHAAALLLLQKFISIFNPPVLHAFISSVPSLFCLEAALASLSYLRVALIREENEVANTKKHLSELEPDPVLERASETFVVMQKFLAEIEQELQTRLNLLLKEKDPLEQIKQIFDTEKDTLRMLTEPLLTSLVIKTLAVDNPVDILEKLTAILSTSKTLTMLACAYQIMTRIVNTAILQDNHVALKKIAQFLLEKCQDEKWHLLAFDSFQKRQSCGLLFLQLLLGIDKAQAERKPEAKLTTIALLERQIKLPSGSKKQVEQAFSFAKSWSLLLLQLAMGNGTSAALSQHNAAFVPYIIYFISHKIFWEKEGGLVADAALEALPFFVRQAPVIAEIIVAALFVSMRETCALSNHCAIASKLIVTILQLITVHPDLAPKLIAADAKDRQEWESVLQLIKGEAEEFGDTELPGRIKILEEKIALLPKVVASSPKSVVVAVSPAVESEPVEEEALPVAAATAKVEQGAPAASARVMAAMLQEDYVGSDVWQVVGKGGAPAHRKKGKTADGAAVADAKPSKPKSAPKPAAPAAVAAVAVPVAAAAATTPARVPQETEFVQRETSSAGPSGKLRFFTDVTAEQSGALLERVLLRALQEKPFLFLERLLRAYPQQLFLYGGAISELFLSKINLDAAEPRPLRNLNLLWVGSIEDIMPIIMQLGGSLTAPPHDTTHGRYLKMTLNDFPLEVRIVPNERKDAPIAVATQTFGTADFCNSAVALYYDGQIEHHQLLDVSGRGALAICNHQVATIKDAAATFESDSSGPLRFLRVFGELARGTDSLPMSLAPELAAFLHARCTMSLPEDAKKVILPTALFHVFFNRLICPQGAAVYRQAMFGLGEGHNFWQLYFNSVKIAPECKPLMDMLSNAKHDVHHDIMRVLNECQNPQGYNSYHAYNTVCANILAHLARPQAGGADSDSVMRVMQEVETLASIMLPPPAMAQFFQASPAPVRLDPFVELAAGGSR